MKVSLLCVIKIIFCSLPPFTHLKVLTQLNKKKNPKHHHYEFALMQLLGN